MNPRRSWWVAAGMVLWTALGGARAQELSVPVGTGASPPVSEIQAEIAQTEADLAALAELEATWRRQDESQEAALERSLEGVVLLESRLLDAEKGSAEAETIFDEIKPQAAAVLELLDGAIEAAARPLELTDRGAVLVGRRRAFGPPGRTGEAALRHSEAAQTLENLERQETERLADLKLLEIELRMASIQRHVALASRIWDLRQAALHMLPAERRSEVFSFDREGREEIDREIEALRIVVRLQLLRLQTLLKVAAQQVGSVIAAYRVGTMTFKLLLVVLLWRWAQRNRARYIDRLRSKVEGIEDLRQRQRAHSGVEFLSTLAPWGLFLAMLGVLWWTLGDKLDEIPGVASTLIIVAVYGTYRLISDLAVGLMADAMERAGMEISEGLRGSLTSRVRWVLRVATLVVVVLALISYRLGEGVLHAHLGRIGWIVVLGLLFLVLGGLKEEISELYLATRARGKLARLVRETRSRWVGRLLAPVAFIWLVGWSIFTLLRNVAYSFEHTRTAGAYLSRRRLEKTAGREGYASGKLEELPGPLAAGLDSTVSVADVRRLEPVSGMDEIRESVALWRRGEGGGSFLLAGDEGVGKRAWISRFAQDESVDHRVEPNRRLMNSGALLRWLSRELLGEDESRNRAALIARIEEGPQRVVVIERAERLFLSTVNGYHALAELGPVVDGTRRKVFWMLSMGGLAWNHLRAAGKDLAFLRRKASLALWSELQIAELIRHRLAAIDAEVSYARLMSGDSRREDRESRNRQGEKAFMNLLWDFSGGNPKVALHFFARSLENGRDGVLRVRPFRRPPERELEDLGDEGLFILAAIARHGSLTPREAARATDFSVDRVQARLIRLQDLDVVRRAAGSYRVTTGWRSTVLLVLRRHNILVS